MINRVKNTENTLLAHVIEKFVAMTGIDVRIVEREYAVALGKKVDALVEICTGKQEPVRYAVEIKQHLNMAALGVLAERLKIIPYTGMLITELVNPKMAERLKALGIAYIDLAGNAYLNESPIFIYIKGNKLADKKALEIVYKPTRAFRASGLKILFAFINKPELLSATYRDIAKIAGVAIGTIGWVMSDLREHGYLLEGKDRERRFIRRKELIDQWVVAYPEKLRPKLTLGRYRAPDREWWKDVKLENYGAQWGGEVAATKLTKYLIPDRGTIYAPEIPPRLLVEHTLKKDPEGDVEILERFWNSGAAQQQTNDGFEDIVPKLLVYADLMATADDRNIETARIIYDEYLNGLVG